MATFGFVAGTLVHTDKGLVSIEQIKVGDKVLSKHESGEGGVAYKRVASTFKSAEKQKIIRVVYTRPQVMDKALIDKLIADNYGYEGVVYNSQKLPRTGELYLYCTENHPFWTKEYGWVTAVNLTNNAHTRKYEPEKECTLMNYQGIPLFDAEYTVPIPLKRTTIPDVAVQTKLYEKRCDVEIESITDFRSGKPILIDMTPFRDFGLPINKYYSEEQDYIELSESSENFKCTFTEEGNFYIGGDVYTYEMGHFKSYDELSDDIDWTDERLEKEIKKSEDSQYYLATVYNIEVEDHHTYYVGKDGIWVHALP